MRKTRTTAFGAGLMLITAVSVAAAAPALAQGNMENTGSFLFTGSKNFAAPRAIGDPGIKLGGKNFRKRRAFNPQPDPPRKLRAGNPPDPDKRKTSNPPQPDKHKTHRRR